MELYRESLIKLKIGLSTLHSSSVSSTVHGHVSLSKNLSVNFYSPGTTFCIFH